MSVLSRIKIYIFVPGNSMLIIYFVSSVVFIYCYSSGTEVPTFLLDVTDQQIKIVEPLLFQLLSRHAWTINLRTPILIVIRHAWTDRQSIPCDRPSRTVLIKSSKANSFSILFGMCFVTPAVLLELIPTQFKVFLRSCGGCNFLRSDAYISSGPMLISTQVQCLYPVVVVARITALLHFLVLRCLLHYKLRILRESCYGGIKWMGILLCQRNGCHIGVGMIQYILQRKGVDALKKCCKADSTNILLLRTTSWKITMLSIKRDGE